MEEALITLNYKKDAAARSLLSDLGGWLMKLEAIGSNENPIVRDVLVTMYKFANAYTRAILEKGSPVTGRRLILASSPLTVLEPNVPVGPSGCDSYTLMVTFFTNLAEQFVNMYTMKKRDYVHCQASVHNSDADLSAAASSVWNIDVTGGTGSTGVLRYLQGVINRRAVPMPGIREQLAIAFMCLTVKRIKARTVVLEKQQQMGRPKDWDEFSYIELHDCYLIACRWNRHVHGVQWWTHNRVPEIDFERDYRARFNPDAEIARAKADSWQQLKICISLSTTDSIAVTETTPANAP